MSFLLFSVFILPLFSTASCGIRRKDILMQRTAPPPKAGIGSRLGKAALAVVLAVSLTPPLVPTTAHADTQGTTIAEQLREANAQIEAQGFTTIGSQAYNWLEDEAPAAKARNAELPAQYDLREQGVVTPVKLQNPWGTCWGFLLLLLQKPVFCLS